MGFRARQAWEFWDMFPWCVLSISSHLIFSDEEHDESKSRRVAKDLLVKYDAEPVKTKLGSVTQFFFCSLRESCLLYFF
jgi:hypothetical protein